MPQLALNLCGGRDTPRRVDASAARRQHTHPPITELVADALDDDRLGVGDGAVRGLVAHVGDQILGRRHDQIMVADQARDRAAGGG